LSQDFKDFELIIIDDASSDGTEALIKDYIARDNRIKYFRNEFNRGITKSRNRGCEIAESEYIAMLDSDDWWLDENKLELQIKFLESYPAVGIMGTGIILYDKDNNFIKEDIFAGDDERIRRKILAKNQFAQSSVVFRRDAYIAAGGYDESLSVCEDLDLWLKIGTRYQLANITEAMTAYYVNPEGITKLDRRRVNKTTDKIIKKYKFDYPGYLKAKIKSVLRMIFI
jgi:glycosyltransferase involved in cell wall biosynthesis